MECWGSYTNFETAYSLPLPGAIKDTTQVIYDHDFNFMDSFKDAASSVNAARSNRRNSRITGAVVGGAVGALGALGKATGFALNTLKTVTLSSPKFKMYDLEFRLHPKNRRESDMILKIITSLKKGMLPDFALSGFGFAFPSVYVNFYNTGYQYLHKFKPAVLAGLTVDYLGGAATPAFFRSPEGHAIPEGVILQTSWIELELWLSRDVRTDANGLPTNNPFDAVRSTLG